MSSQMWRDRVYCPFHHLNGIVFRLRQGRFTIRNIDIDGAQERYPILLQMHGESNATRDSILGEMFGDIADTIIAFLNFPLEAKEIKTLQKKLMRRYNNIVFSRNELREIVIYANWVRIYKLKKCFFCVCEWALTH